MKIPIYWMPGLGASSQIFENITLPKDTFESYFLEWLEPVFKESITEYALRMAQKIKHPNPVLIGVSFGGILVQEIAKHIATQKIIIISSVKSSQEMPRRMKIAKKTGIYKLLPTSLLTHLGFITQYSLGRTINKRLKLYEKYLQMRSKKYLDWALENVILWKQISPSPNIIHIHGTNDLVFPAKYIQNYIPVKEGTHVMIIYKYKWFNKHLPKLILNK